MQAPTTTQRTHAAILMAWHDAINVGKTETDALAWLNCPPEHFHDLLTGRELITLPELFAFADNLEVDAGTWLA